MTMLAMACATPRARLQVAGFRAEPVEGLGPCDDRTRSLTIDPHRPVVVLVHGCHASAGRFRSLAKVFELHEQQAVCFEYDDRARIRRSAHALGEALEQLSQRVDAHDLVVLGHSQGGLIARAALSDPALSTHAMRLVTVSSSFNGIRAARDCGALWLHVASLGTTIAVCRAVTGAKWNEIHPRARGVMEPPPLSSRVREHLRVITDERNTCRTRAEGACVQDDFVFSIEEQDNRRMLHDARFRSATVAAGHAEIVGNEALKPHKLIAILQEHRVMRPTPESKRVALARLLERLF